MASPDHTAPVESLRQRALGGRAPASLPILLATAGLFLISLVFELQSVRHSALLGMLPFAGVLAIAAMGQTLVIQQGGIDLSVPGMISLTVVLMTSVPKGHDGRLPLAIVYAIAGTLLAGALSGVLVSRVGITPIVTTLGMNALLYGAVVKISGGTPNVTTHRLSAFVNSTELGIPTTVLIAVGITIVVGFAVKKTVLGRRFEAVGANAASARTAGLVIRRYQLGAYVGAAFLYFCGGCLLGGLIGQPSAFQGDQYLLPSVAAVVLGGTSLLGGVGSAAASAIGALFLTQLEQLVLTTGVNTGVQYLIEAAAIGAGVGVYNLRVSRVRSWLAGLRGRDRAAVASSAEPV
jgi:ribose transport system permease protein